MSKAKSLFAAGFAVMTFSAVASATASAATGWDVGGTLLVGTAALANTALILAFGQLKTAAVEIQCQGHEIGISEGFIRHPDELQAKDLTFHTCKILNEVSGCKLSSETILTLAIHGLAELDTKSSTLNTLILILPLPSKTFAVLTYEGEQCALTGNQPITANKNPAIDFLIDEGGVSLLLHLVLAFSLPESLRLEGKEASLEGLDFDIRLASDQTWAFL